ncbi:MAG: porin family protein [Bacteroidales bacterium]|nr:porin family protein [Bacteroidales bacterium]
MKKILLFAFGLILINSVTAQDFKEKIAFGGGFSYGTEIENLGINIRGLYEVTEEIHGLMNFTFFFPKKETIGTAEWKWHLWELNFDGHYVFTSSDKFSAYGLAGLNITHWKSKWEEDTYTYMGYAYGGDFESSETEVGFNIGGGATYSFTGALIGFGEIKYVVSNYDQAVFTFGVLYHL